MKSSIKKTDPLVSIIIPAFRSEVLIQRLIESLQQTTYSNYEVLIVFDPSEKGHDKGPLIAKQLTKGDKRWRFIKNTTRLGSTKSLNLGIKKSKGEFISFVACDMTLDPKWLRKLMDYLLKSDKTVGGTIAKFYDFHQHNRIQVYRHYLQKHTGWIVSMDLGKKDGAEFKKPIETFNGFEGLVLRKQVFADVGGFDEDIDALIYDLDMNWRVWLGGYRIVLVPEAKVYHWSLKEGRQNAKWEFFYGRMLNIFIKNYSFKSLLIYLPQFITIYTVRAVLLLFRGNTDAIIGWSQVIKWSLQNLPQTLEKRRKIQTQVRKVSDDYLFKKIFFKGSLYDFYQYLYNAKTNVSPILLNKESSNREVISYSVK